LEDLKGAIARAQKYIEAGADAIFPEALQSADEFKTFVREVPVPLLANMTEFGKSPLLSFHELAEIGYRMVIFPMSAFRVAMKTTEAFFRALKEQGTSAAWLDKMQTRKELYDLLEYDPAAESWPGYSTAENG
jgi:methylisocitrate lyase